MRICSQLLLISGQTHKYPDSDYHCEYCKQRMANNMFEFGGKFIASYHVSFFLRLFRFYYYFNIKRCHNRERNRRKINCYIIGLNENNRMRNPTHIQIPRVFIQAFPLWTTDSKSRGFVSRIRWIRANGNEFESLKEMLRIQKYPDTCGRGLCNVGLTPG